MNKRIVATGLATLLLGGSAVYLNTTNLKNDALHTFNTKSSKSEDRQKGKLPKIHPHVYIKSPVPKPFTGPVFSALQIYQLPLDDFSLEALNQIYKNYLGQEIDVNYMCVNDVCDIKLSQVGNLPYLPGKHSLVKLNLQNIGVIEMSMLSLSPFCDHLPNTTDSISASFIDINGDSKWRVTSVECGQHSLVINGEQSYTLDTFISDFK